VAKVKAYYRSPEGAIEEQMLEEIDANLAIRLFPHEWSLTGKFGDPADPVAAQRRRLLAQGPEGDAARAAERGVG
jgi:hypothetical protein